MFVADSSEPTGAGQRRSEPSEAVDSDICIVGELALGQIEVKVFYAHEAESERREKWYVLVRQLRARATYKAHTTNRRKQRFYALAWLFEHGGCLRLASLRDHLTSAAANDAILATASGLTPEAHDLGALWPSTGGSTYACGLDLVLFELCENADEDALGAG